MWLCSISAAVEGMTRGMRHVTALTNTCCMGCSAWVWVNYTFPEGLVE